MQNCTKKCQADKKVIQSKIVSQTCTKCGVEKKIEEMTLGTNHCKGCRGDQLRLRIHTNVGAFLGILCNHAKASAAGRLENGRVDAGKYEIDKQYVMSLCEQQDGRCY